MTPCKCSCIIKHYSCWINVINTIFDIEGTNPIQEKLAHLSGFTQSLPRNNVLDEVGLELCLK